MTFAWPEMLWLLGLESPGEWDGTPVTKAFHAPPVPTTR